MGQHGDSASFMNQSNGISWRKSRLLEIGGSAFRKKPVEGILNALGVTSFDHQSREVRAAYNFVPGQARYIFIAYVKTESLQTRSYLRVPSLSRAPQLGKLCQKRRAFIVDIVSEYVHSPGRILGADLNPINQLDPEMLGGLSAFS